MADLAGNVLANRGVKILGEVGVLPGTSRLLDGKIVEGGLHVVGGLAARALFGPIGWLLVAANSYSRSVTEQHLHQQVADAYDDRKAGAEAAEAN